MTIRWGILGTGKIAHLVASDLQLLPDAELTAIASRAQERSHAFGDQYDVPFRYSSYEDLVADDEVDVVHVGTPHSHHVRHASMALEAGHAVLCEKPLAMNTREAEDLIRTAREKEQFLMEAMWTRFLPVMDDVRWLLDEEDAVGEIRQLRADIGFHQPYDPDHRLFDPTLGGGALLDLGIYPIALVHELLGSPDSITTSATLADTGVDAQCAAIFDYEDGAQVTWQASLYADAGRTCSIAGPKGRLEGTRAWWKGAPFHLTREDGSKQTLARPFAGNGYQFEMAHVNQCLRDERTESPVMPLDESYALLETMDTLRERWGLTYPGEA